MFVDVSFVSICMQNISNLSIPSTCFFTYITVMLKKIGPDKWTHFYVGILMGALLQSVTWYLLPGRPVLDTVLTFVAVVAISYGFEVLSLVTGKGHYEVMDAIAAVIGGIIGMGIGGIFIYVLEHQLGV